MLLASPAQTDLLGLTGPVRAANPGSPCPRDGLRGAESCEGCHQPDPLFSHPVGVVPSMRVPGYMPLEGRRITCVTCHDGPRFEAGSGARQEFIGASGSPSRGLCIQCHVGVENDGRAMHALGSGRAHLLWRGGSGGSGQNSLGPRQTAASDEAPGRSRECLSCHDGSIAFDANRLSSHGGFGVGEHPVDVPYLGSLSASGRVGRKLTPISSLDPRLRLSSGNVGCETCHSPYSTRDHQLVMSNRGSQLCRSCHRV